LRNWVTTYSIGTPTRFGGGNGRRKKETPGPALMVTCFLVGAVVVVGLQGAVESWGIGIAVGVLRTLTIYLC
jgi:hypothetical protein